MVQEKEIIAVNDQLKVGMILDKPSYMVDLWMVTAIQDGAGHWRGPNNKLVTIISVHDLAHGFLDFPLSPYIESTEHYVKTTLCACRHGMPHSLPFFDGRHWVESGTEDTVHTHDIAEGHFQIFANDLTEAKEKLGE